MTDLDEGLRRIRDATARAADAALPPRDATIRRCRGCGGWMKANARSRHDFCPVCSRRPRAPQPA